MHDLTLHASELTKVTCLTSKVCTETINYLTN